MTERDKIMNMNYEEVLRIWRFAPSSHDYISGDNSNNFVARFKQLQNDIDFEEKKEISKRVGWNPFVNFNKK